MLRKGFTLIELLIVITIIAILAGAAIPYVQDYVEDARIAKARSDLDEIKNALVRYELDTGTTYTAANIANLVGPYLQKALIDPWGAPYVVSDTDNVTYSLGPDGTAATGDEITVEFRPPLALSKCYYEDTTKDGLVNDGDTLILKFTRPVISDSSADPVVGDFSFSGTGALTAIGAVSYQNNDRQCRIPLTTVTTAFIPGKELININGGSLRDKAVPPFGPNFIKNNAVKIQSLQ
jgi:general secretion pathway protein G